MTKRVKIIIGSIAGGVVLFGGIAYKNNTRDYISDFAIAGMGSSSSAVDVQSEIDRVQSESEPAESDAAQSTSAEQSESSIDLNSASTPEQLSIDVNSSTSSVSNTSSVSKQSSASVNSATANTSSVPKQSSANVEQSEIKPAESSSKSQSSKSQSSSVDRSPSVESAPSTPAESSKPAPQSSESASAPSVSNNEQSDYYVLNTNSKKVHLPTCGSVKTIKSENYAETTDLASAISQGYTACKRCKPF